MRVFELDLPQHREAVVLDGKQQLSRLEAQCFSVGKATPEERVGAMLCPVDEIGSEIGADDQADRRRA